MLARARTCTCGRVCAYLTHAPTRVKLSREIVSSFEREIVISLWCHAAEVEL